MNHRFRLERVRALRERHEEEAKLEFAGALRRHTECEQQLALADAQIADARATPPADSALSAGDLQGHQLYLERLERAQRNVQDQLHRHHTDMEIRRSALTKASQEREALEKLKERSHAASARELARVEQNSLDEIAGNGHWRRVA